MSRQTGRNSNAAGHAAEDLVADIYRQRGGSVREIRHRTPYGELDLIVDLPEALVFVEVKMRRLSNAAAEAISPRQWRRLEEAALYYTMSAEIEPDRTQRFDVAIMSRAGLVELIENARYFDG